MAQASQIQSCLEQLHQPKAPFQYTIMDHSLSNRHYFAGIHNGWNLVATTKRNPRLLNTYPTEAYSVKSISCVPREHAVVSLWDDLAKEIIPLNQKNAFRVFTCYQIGNNRDFDTAPVVGLLHVQAGAFDVGAGENLAREILTKYQNLLSKCEALSNRPAIETDLTIEIVEIVSCSDDLAQSIDGSPPYEQYCQPGSSIGFKGSDSSGSIGAFFQVTLKNHETKKVLLTNHHVVKPPLPDDKKKAKGKDQTREENRKEQGKACPWAEVAWSNNPPSNLLSPSPEDIKHTKDGYVTTIEAANLRIVNRENQLCDTTLRLDITRQETYRKQIKAQKELVSRLQEALTALDLQDSKWSLGCRLVTSGWRTDIQGNQMDWALATLAKSANFSNILPELPSKIRIKVERHFYYIPKALESISSSPLALGEYVIKFGRTTGWTIGNVNQCHAHHFNWLKNRQKTVAYSIVGLGGSLFCDKGDSGSVIINTMGEAAALLFAGETSGGTAYAADIMHVINDIKKNTEIEAMELAAKPGANIV